MGGGEVRHRVAIFGGGRVGTAMSLEMPGVPIIRRGQDCACDIAVICWPAQAIKDFAVVCPQAAAGYTVAFCNGVWAEEDGVNEQGCCYVRATNIGDRAAPGRKGWRVSSQRAAGPLRTAGLNIVISQKDHRAQLWGKALYIIPLAVTCQELNVPAREALDSILWQEWFDFVQDEAEEELGEEVMAAPRKRALWLCERLPKGWRPSSSVEEIDYFKGKICQ